MKKDYEKVKKWLDKKVNSISLVCSESNMVEICYDTWWLVVQSMLQCVAGFAKPKETSKK